LAILSRLSRFPSPAVGTNWPFCVDVPLKHQSINQSINRSIQTSRECLTFYRLVFSKKLSSSTVVLQLLLWNRSCLAFHLIVNSCCVNCIPNSLYSATAEEAWSWIVISPYRLIFNLSILSKLLEIFIDFMAAAGSAVVIPNKLQNGDGRAVL